MGKQQNEGWGSRLGLILAMAGNAVGLANFLRFPIQAIDNGGGAFIIPYLVCFVVLGIPLLWVEWAVGRIGGRLGNHSTPFILDGMGKRKFWKYIGVFGIFTNVVVMAYYSYIESWSLAYMYYSIKGAFAGMDQADVADFFNNYVNLLDGSFLGSSTTLMFYLVTLLVNTFILSKGIKGIEKVAKIGMPLLLLFGVLLAIRGLTLGTSGANAVFPDASAWDGLNFLWEVNFTSLSDPKVWLAAAGQIFFTLGLGWGFIQTYAAYMDSKKDIALSALAAGFTNEFVEIVIGSLIIIPIASGYLGFDWVRENSSFGMAFQTMPFLFDQLGAFVGSFAGFMWFGLLFFAGITSSVAMGSTWTSFMKDEFNWNNSNSSWVFGAMVLLIGLPTILFYQYGVFDEYDYWAGTVCLVVFAMLEIILFSWVFGINRGWKEITIGADIRIPLFFKFLLKYVTPTLIIIVFLGALFAPEGNDWLGYLNGLFRGEPWVFDSGSIISKLAYMEEREQLAQATTAAERSLLENKILFSKIARALLTFVFVFISFLVYRAYKKRLALNPLKN